VFTRSDPGTFSLVVVRRSIQANFVFVGYDAVPIARMASERLRINFNFGSVFGSGGRSKFPYQFTTNEFALRY
jgi:hypothetical protein